MTNPMVEVLSLFKSTFEKKSIGIDELFPF